MRFNGLRIVMTPLAERMVRQPRIERTAIKKRRRSWTLRYETKREPCAYVAGDVFTCTRAPTRRWLRKE